MQQFLILLAVLLVLASASMSMTYMGVRSPGQSAERAQIWAVLLLLFLVLYVTAGIWLVKLYLLLLGLSLSLGILKRINEKTGDEP
jgi:hypothetical protein